MGSEQRGHALAQLQMQQRVWSPGLVVFTAANLLEVSMYIEPNRLDILLVDINLIDTVFIDCVTQKSGTDTTTAVLGVDEQHFQVPVEHSRESRWLAIYLGDSERNGRKVVAH